LAPVTVQQTMPPTLPPYTAVWDEVTWRAQATSSFGPIFWPHPQQSSSPPLQLTILNSLTDPLDTLVLEATVQNWQSSSSNAVELTVESSPLLATTLTNTTEDCVPTLGHIRVCNGNYGDTTDAKFVSYIYVNGREILAATIYINDDFGLEALHTVKSLQYNLCHELGHALGIFHNAERGCMVERLTPELDQQDYLHPDPSDLDQLNQLYKTTTTDSNNDNGRTRRQLRRGDGNDGSSRQ
jgi:hypothetical protein